MEVEMSAETHAAEVARIQERAAGVARAVPDEVAEAARIQDKAIAEKERELAALRAQRARVDASYGITQRQARERAHHESEWAIKCTAETALETIDQINATLDETQRLISAGFAKIKGAEALFLVAHQTTGRVIESSSTFSPHDFQRRLAEHIATEFCRAWPGNATYLGGGMIEWRIPPMFSFGGKERALWSEVEGLANGRATTIATLNKLVDDRRHLTDPYAVDTDIED